MAAEIMVKQYLAYWFQLGKKVAIPRGVAVRPTRVIHGDRYSHEFEVCWQQILSPESEGAYLEGTDVTVRELLTSQWAIAPCARCEMPVPMKEHGIPPTSCPCSDLLDWPNTDLPLPRAPVDTQVRLQCLLDRLQRVNDDRDDEAQAPEETSSYTEDRADRPCTSLENPLEGSEANDGSPTEIHSLRGLLRLRSQ